MVWLTLTTRDPRLPNRKVQFCHLIWRATIFTQRGFEPFDRVASAALNTCDTIRNAYNALTADVLSVYRTEPAKTEKTRIWANAQRDGRPAEYR